MNTKDTLQRAHRALRVIVGIVWTAWTVTAFVRRIGTPSSWSSSSAAASPASRRRTSSPSRGVPFVLLEASSRTGGLIRTDHVDGFTIEAGADSMLAPKPAAIRLCEELGLGPRLMSTTPPRTAFVLRTAGCTRCRRHRSSAFRPRALASRSTACSRRRPRHLARAMDASPAATGRTRSRTTSRWRSFFRRRFGPATVSLIAEPLLGGIHAGDIETLSMTVAPAPRGRGRRGPSLPGAAARPGRRRRTLPSAARRHGRARLGDRGAGCLPGSVRVRTGAQAVSFARTGVAGRDRGRSVRRARGHPGRARARGGTLLAPIDAPLAALCAEVPYVSTVSVALAWPRASVAHPLAGSGFVVARRHSRAAHHGLHVGVVEVAGPRAAGHGAPARVPRRRVTIPTRSTFPTTRSSTSREGHLLRPPHHGRPAPRPRASLAARRRAAQRRTCRSLSRVERAARGPARTLRRRQRLPLGRHSGLRRRRPGGRGPGGGIR